MTKTQQELRNLRLKFYILNNQNTYVQTVPESDLKSLRRLALRLHRQFEIQCNGTAFTSHAGQYADSDWWYKESEKHVQKAERAEIVCINKIKSICESNNLFYYIQTDPRGGTLYISHEPLNDQNYHYGVFVA